MSTRERFPILPKFRGTLHPTLEFMQELPRGREYYTAARTGTSLTTSSPQAFLASRLGGSVGHGVYYFFLPYRTPTLVATSAPLEVPAYANVLAPVLTLYVLHHALRAALFALYCCALLYSNPGRGPRGMTGGVF